MSAGGGYRGRRSTFFHGGGGGAPASPAAVVEAEGDVLSAGGGPVAIAQLVRKIEAPLGFGRRFRCPKLLLISFSRGRTPAGVPPMRRYAKIGAPRLIELRFPFCFLLLYTDHGHFRKTFLERRRFQLGRHPSHDPFIDHAVPAAVALQGRPRKGTSKKTA